MVIYNRILCFFSLTAVLRIREIFVRIREIFSRIRIRIHGSVPLTYGSGSGSCYFRH
jgi:hypothetical protein